MNEADSGLQKLHS